MLATVTVVYPGSSDWLFVMGLLAFSAVVVCAVLRRWNDA